MKSKYWVILFLSTAILFLGLFAGTMYYMDPLLQYRSESGPLTYYVYDNMYTNPGIAKNYTYDAVMVGTSMVENTSVAECNEAFDCNMVRLQYSGGTTYNMKTILDLCYASGNNIETVYWEMDEFQLRSTHDAPRFPLPTYLYRTDHAEDLSYLLNLDIFYNYLIPSWKGTQSGIIQNALYDPYPTTGYSREIAINNYPRPEQQQESIPADSFLEMARNNLETNVLSLVDGHPETEFVFFFVPFSMMYWDYESLNGTLDATMESLRYAIGELLTRENVRIYFYHDEWEIAENLELYCDYSHYNPSINSFMVQAMAADTDRLTLDNYCQVLNEMHLYLKNYDYSQLFIE